MPKNYQPIQQQFIPVHLLHQGCPTRVKTGDIIIRDATNTPLLVYGSPSHLDDGSGVCDYIWVEDEYRIIGNIYTSGIKLLNPLLEHKGRKFNYKMYGIKKI